MIPGLRTDSAGQDAIETKPDSEYRAQHVPPVHKRAHLGIALGSGWINLCDRRLGGAIAELQQFHQEINFELIAVEPFLVQIDARISEDGYLHGSVSVRALTDQLATKQTHQSRVQPRSHFPVQRHVATVSSALEKT